MQRIRGASRVLVVRVAWPWYSVSPHVGPAPAGTTTRRRAACPALRARRDRVRAAVRVHGLDLLDACEGIRRVVAHREDADSSQPVGAPPAPARHHTGARPSWYPRPGAAGRRPRCRAVPQDGSFWAPSQAKSLTSRGGGVGDVEDPYTAARPGTGRARRLRCSSRRRPSPWPGVRVRRRVRRRAKISSILLCWSPGAAAAGDNAKATIVATSTRNDRLIVPLHLP